MEYTTIKCPSCGANVQFRPGKSKAICEYCGSTVVSEDYGNRDSALELADSINNLIGALEDRNECKRRLMDIKVRYNDTVKRYKSLQAHRLGEICKYPACSALAAVLFLLVVLSEESLWYLLLTVIAGVLTYPLYQYSVQKYVNALQRLRGTLRDYKNRIADCQNELDEINQKADFSIVPERYLEVEALRFIAGALISGQAYDLYQAIAQYNAESKRREERDFLQTQLSEQRRQLDEIRANQERGRRSAAADDAEDVENAIKAVATTGAALYAGYKILKKITK